MGGLARDPPLNVRRLSFTPPIIGVFAAILFALALAAGQVAGQAQATALQLISRDARRALPITMSGSQEMLALADLAAVFQLNVRDDGGAITVGYKGRTIILTPDQTIASVAGRLISLPIAPVRAGNGWLVPVDFVSRALAPIYDVRLDLRRTSHLLIVGDMRVPRVVVRHDMLGASARVTIDISPAAAASVIQQANQRLLVRLEADALDVSLPTFQSAGFVESIRTADGTTLELDLGPRFGSFRSTTAPLDSGTRVTIDVVGAQTDVIPTPGQPPPSPPEIQTPLAPATPAIRAVAIDAGHGGAEAGSRGAAGTLEKDVALSVGRRLKAALEARLGVRVVMTREDDRDLTIENRTAIANNNKADLFVSLHANASFRPEVVGAAVYVAAFSESDLSSEGLAPERLPVFGGGLRSIEVVPWNLAQIPHREESDRFAQAVSNALNGHVPLAPRPVEHAPLRVLESANMPAVLLEMAYLTNADQEKALSGAETQNAIVQALLDAIVRFRDALPGAAEGPAR
jgi:N-acetylmuramoyl-L-alanine amidase